MSFNTIPSLGPGHELRLKINAKAQVPGAHVFRAEVHCRPLGSRLVREETTQFYATDANAAAASNGSSSANRLPPDISATRTAERPLAGYAQPGASYAQPSGSYPQPSGSYSQPGGSYPQPGGSYPQPGGYGNPSGNSIPTRVYR